MEIFTQIQPVLNTVLLAGLFTLAVYNNFWKPRP